MRRLAPKPCAACAVASRGTQAGAEIPFDDTHLHFGKGQTEASITLSPGKHKLTLQFANALHKRCVVRAKRRVSCDF